MAKHGIGLVMGVALFLSPALGWSYWPSRDSTFAFAPTHVVVRVAEAIPSARNIRTPAASGFGIAEIARIHERFGIKQASRLLPLPPGSERQHPLGNVWIVEAPEGTDFDQLLGAYRSVPEVIYAELDRPVSLFEVNDSLYPMQWALHNTGQPHPAVLPVLGTHNDSLRYAAGLAGADIDADSVISAPEAVTTPTVVAIIDTGVDPSHPELAGRMWQNPREIPDNGADDDHNGYIDDVNGWDHSGDVFQIPPVGNGDSNPADYFGHGTHCAGTVAALTDNGRGMAGVGGNCLIMPVKIFPLALNSIAARAIVYAVDNGADVISMSWGSPWRSQVLEDAIQYALAAGVVLCASSGNDGTPVPMYPAAYPGVIAVGATDDGDRVTSFSSYGDHLSLVAPGLDIVSLRARGTDMYAPSESGVHKIGDGYYVASGTSMSAPFVAGAAARLRQASGGLLPLKVRDLMERSADDLTDPQGDGKSLPGRDVYSGAGRLNVGSLMALAPGEAARVSWPRPFETVTGTVQITGTAMSDQGLSYILEYGRGAQPVSWTEVATGLAARREAVLGQWRTDSLNGLYTLRLRVGDANLAQVKIYAGNARLAQITTPAQGDTVISWIDVKGSASDGQFQAYLVELGESTSPSQWSVIEHGTQPVVNGLLASWHADQLPDGWYSFRLLLITDSGLVVADTVAFFLRSTFSTSRAWKVPLGTPGVALVASYGQFDSDPALEIVVATSDGIRAFDPSGQIDLATTARFARAGACSTPLAIGDTDGDGKDDLVAVNDSGVLWIFPSTEQVRAIPTRQHPMLGVSRAIEEFALPSLFLKDTDGDGRDEIHYYPGYEEVYPRSYWIFTSDGRPPLEISRERFTTRLEFMEYFPADLNADGKDELYVANEQLYKLDGSGNLVDSVALMDNQGRVAQAKTCSAVDLDSDGVLELVVMAITKGSPSTYVLYVFEDDLSLKPGWPRDTGIDSYWSPSDPVFCDLDGDSHPEYFIAWSDNLFGRISAWHPDGTPLSGQADYSVWTSSTDPAMFRSPVASDLDGDGLPDLISCATEDMFNTFPVERLLAWDRLGQVLPGWPVIVESGTRMVGASERHSTACGDIDRDGTTDVMMVTAENNLVFINVPGAPYDSASARVGFWRYNRRLNNTVDVPGQLRVSSIAPTWFEPDVETSPAIRFGFNLALDAAQDFSRAFDVRGSITGSHVGTVTYDPITQGLTFEPAIEFAPDEKVAVRLSRNLRSESGSMLPQDFTSAFVVGARIPAAQAPNPLPGQLDVDRYTSLTFELNTAVDLESIGDTTLQVWGNLSGPCPGSLRYDSITRVATFVPQAAFAPAEVITASVQPGIRSRHGILSDTTFTWSFTIAWPKATATVPAANATGAPRSTFVSASMDGPLPEFAIYDSSCYVYSATSGRKTGVVSYVPSTQTLRFTPAEPFYMGEQLMAIVPSLRRVWNFGINTVGGPIRFVPPQVYLTDESPRLVTAGDLDGDARVDLAAGRWPSPFVYLLRHAGVGAFALDSVLTGGVVGQVLLADLDGDADPELVATDQIGHSLAVLRNLGAGRFSPPTVVVVPGILECGTQDFNGDGHLDLYSQAMNSAQVAVLLNTGDGTFAELPRLPTPMVASTAVAIDFNSDGHADVVAGDMQGNVTLFAGDGAGHFLPSISRSTHASVMQLVGADCDRDGDLDLLVLHPGGLLDVWRNDSAGSYSLDTVYAVAPGVRQMQTADFDADGRLDLALAGGNDRTVYVMRGVASGGFSPSAQVVVGDSVWSVAVADFDSDGDLDLATGGQRSLNVMYFGSGSAVGEESGPVVPAQFELSQNYPNPFNPSTTIGFALPEPSRVDLAVFNILGQQVALLKDEVLAAGYYKLTWDGRSDGGTPLPTGVYFYRLKTETTTLTHRMLLLK